jgi:hypothetical protein
VSLDCLRSFPNVLLLTTSNLTSSVNVKFLDRANLKVSVGLPILEARYEILKETLMELLHVGIVWDHYVGIVRHLFLHDQWARRLQWALSEMRQSCWGLECTKPLTAAFIESCAVYQIYRKGFLGELYQGTKTGNYSSTKIYQPLKESSLTW